MQQQTRLSRQAAAQKEKADALLSGVRLELRQRQEELEAQSAELAWLKHEVTRAAREADEASRATAQVLVEAAAALTSTLTLTVSLTLHLTLNLTLPLSLTRCSSRPRRRRRTSRPSCATRARRATRSASGGMRCS